MPNWFVKKEKKTLAEIVKFYFDENRRWKETDDNHDVLVEIVSSIRPKKPKTIVEIDLTDLITILAENKSIANEFSTYLTTLFSEKKISKILTDAAILQDVAFFHEIKKRAFAKILPYQHPIDSLEYVLSQVFYSDTDPLWISKIPQAQIEELYDLLGFTSIYETIKQNSVLSEIMISMSLISQRMSGRALESDVLKMVPEYFHYESPFASFEKELHLIENSLRESKNSHCITSDSLSYKQLLVLHKQCEEYVKKAFTNSSKYGITIHVNQSLLRIRQQLYRLKILLPLLTVDKKIDKKRNSIRLVYKLIKYNCTRNNLRTFIKESTQLLSYEVTQHTAKTGEKYITQSTKEYFKMFNTALGGGFIVGILCIIKVLLSKLDASDFGYAFLYSMNYSIGFIAIYLLGFTLATKQPAMTAAALIRALQDGMKKEDSEEKHQVFAVFFARVFRSQFIAFVGNVIMAFPISLLGIWLIDLAFDSNIAETKWKTLVTDLSPIHSMAIFHAANAGCFLFLSGIISGSVANRDKHYEIYQRIKEHPFLKRTFGKVKAEKLAKLYEMKWAGIISNFWFGIFMGTTASVGVFFGLNLDIRHITFASGNLALGLYGSNYTLDNWMIFWGVFGIGVIGLVNFIVSFSLSLGLAFRSRDIPFTELRSITVSIWQHFKRRPFSFFFPTGTNALTQDGGDKTSQNNSH
ncbi:recombinase [Flavobacterium lacus]|uniref:Site-specific recombinase n=1 Tax=Flavobacterium lacus TaxID=1353778 RepID=A0A328WUL6_9FLAO|nr:recombinase [Flavobacterium lacus]RAR49853.1 site-specific recombinase [Flavobacterium lacus]